LKECWSSRNFFKKNHPSPSVKRLGEALVCRVSDSALKVHSFPGKLRFKIKRDNFSDIVQLILIFSISCYRLKFQKCGIENIIKYAMKYYII
jgi:hypothetical protein